MGPIGADMWPDTGGPGPAPEAGGPALDSGGHGPDIDIGTPPATDMMGAPGPPGPDMGPPGPIGPPPPKSGIMGELCGPLGAPEAVRLTAVIQGG